MRFAVLRAKSIRMIQAMALALMVLGGVAQGALPRLEVSENGRYLVTSDGNPFFWLGDTSWAMLRRCSLKGAPTQPSIVKYFENRAAKGFNVLQTVAVGKPDGSDNPQDPKPFIKGDYSRPAIKDGPNNDYWDKVDGFVDEAERHGIYLALLPVWGDGVPNESPLVKDTKVAYRYGHFLGARYGDCAHIVWTLGGDTSPEKDVMNPERMAMIRAMAEGIADGVNGTDKQDGQADYATTMMTYHPRGGGQSSSIHLHKEPWLDFNMIQTTTCFKFTNYKTITDDYAKEPAKPTLDAEVAYEASFSLKGDGKTKEQRTTPWEARKAAYWSVFAGGFGFTYGHRSFIGFCLPGEQLKWGSHIPWFEKEAIDAPGSFLMGHLRRLMESRPFLSRIPGDDVIAGGAGEGLERAVATRDEKGSYAMVYLPTGRPVTVRMEAIGGERVKAWWFDPRTGKAEEAGRFEGRGKKVFTPPTSGKDNDWILVLDDAAKGFGAPGKQTGLSARNR